MAKMHPAEQHILNVALSQVESFHIKTNDWEHSLTDIWIHNDTPYWEFISKKSSVKLVVSIGTNGIYAHSLWKLNSDHCLEDHNDWVRANP